MTSEAVRGIRGDRTGEVTHARLCVLVIVQGGTGGRLWATAKDGPGTVFRFTLPKYDDEKSATGVTGV